MDMVWKLQENILDKADIEVLVDFIRTTKRFTQFEKVREFEEAWSKWQGSKYSVFVNSGSSANLIMVSLMKQLYGWADQDEVIVPAVTWVTNISPVMQCGLKPVFVDVNLEDFSFDYEDLASKITNRTRAIFVTHLIGFPANIERIRAVVGNRDIRIMEDCCESHGAEIRGVKVGNFGDLSSFSFYWGHHMTTVEGGIISTDREDIFRAALLKRSHGLARELRPEFQIGYAEAHPEIDFNFLFLTDGFNFRNTEFNAVLGLAQLTHLDKYIAIRKDNYARFLEILAPYDRFFHLPHKEGISPFCLPFIVKDVSIKKEFQEALTNAGIESRPVISGNLLRQPFLKDFGPHHQFKNADFLHTNAFYIGNNQFVNGERLALLQRIVQSFFAKKSSAV